MFDSDLLLFFFSTSLTEGILCPQLCVCTRILCTFHKYFSTSYIIEEIMENAKYFVLFCVIIHIESLVVYFLDKM